MDIERRRLDGALLGLRHIVSVLENVACVLLPLLRHAYERRSAMIHLGDKIKRQINLYDQDRGPRPQTVTVEATVVYIHPERRFYTLEYKLPGGHRIRDTEYFYPRCGMDRN